MRQSSKNYKYLHRDAKDSIDYILSHVNEECLLSQCNQSKSVDVNVDQVSASLDQIVPTVEDGQVVYSEVRRSQLIVSIVESEQVVNSEVRSSQLIVPIVESEQAVNSEVRRSQQILASKDAIIPVIGNQKLLAAESSQQHLKSQKKGRCCMCIRTKKDPKVRSTHSVRNIYVAPTRN